MNLWRLELARLRRTHRWMILVGVFGLFAVSGPVLVAYVEEILAQFGGDIVIEIPEQRPVDGIGGYLDNVNGIGVLAIVIVAAAALALDARPEVAAFLRTRIRRPHALVIPRYAVVAGASAASLVGGMAVAWLLTWSLIGTLPAGPMLLGTLYGALYVAFAVAVVAAVAGYTRGVVGTILASVIVLLLVALLGLIEPVRPWLPGDLLTAVLRLVEGTPAGEFARAVVVSLVVTPALLALAIHRFARREL
jgi:ABC-2 type transport system permease protein